MFHQQSANLEYKHYHTGDPCHLHYDWKIEHCEEEDVYTHIRIAHLRFQNFRVLYYYQLVQLVFQAKVPLVLMEVCPFVYAFSISAGSLLCHFGKKCSWQVDIHKPLPHVLLSQPSLFYAEETQLPTTSPLAVQLEVTWSANLFSLLQRAKSIL